MKYTFLFALFITFSSSAQVPDTTNRTPPPPPVAVNHNATPQESDVIDFPDVEAKFKGGPKKLQKYISKKVHYPERAIELNQEGIVFMTFIVETDGSVSNVVIQKGAGKILNAEAIRVANSFPKWKPAKVGRTKVRTRCRLPIVFRLE